MGLSAWALRHPVPVAVVTAGAVLLGIIALTDLNREFIPPIVMPTATVVTLWPGVGAEDVEREVTSVLEDSFATLSGLEKLSSESREGLSIIEIQFNEDTVIDTEVQEIRGRVDAAAADLPENLQGRPMVSSWGASDLPVMSFAVSGPWEPDRISRYVDDVVVPELYKVNGVAEAIQLGDRRIGMEVRLDLDSFAGGTPIDVLGAIRTRNTSRPAGLVEWNEGEWALGVSGELNDISKLEGLTVGGTEVSPIRLGDVARISEGYRNPREIVRSSGSDLIVVQVTKREGGNVLSMSREIRRLMTRLENENLGYRFIILHDDSETLKNSLKTVLNSALSGIAMAVGLIWLFLRNWRSTLVIAVSLPVSLVITFAGMRLAGQSINVLTMAGMTVSLGMVVDASIVILENIHRRRLAGEEADTAAREGASSVSGAVIASTTTSISVFAPMIFLTGIIGSIMKDLSVTLVLCLGASLLSALFLVPILTRRGMKADREPARKVRHGRGMRRLEDSYRTSLQRSMEMGGTVIFTAVVILIVSVLAADMMGMTFIPAADYGELFVSMELPPGSSLKDSAAAADRAEAVIRREVPELKEAVFYVGMEDDLSGDARKREAVWGQLLLNAPRRRDRGFTEIIGHLNDVLPDALPGISVLVLNGGFDRMVSMGTDGSGYRVELAAESWPALKTAAKRIEDILAADPDVIHVSRDVGENRRIITAELDGEALGRTGIQSSVAALTARIAFEGIDVGTYRPETGQDKTIRLVTNLDGLSPDSSTLPRIHLRTSAGTIVSLDSLTEIHPETGLSAIRRRDRARTLTVIGYTSHENIRGVSDRLTAALEKEPLDTEVSVRIRGVGGLVEDSIGRMALVLGVSLFLVYAVMAIQFERLVQPLIIMASVPFSFIGTIVGLAVFGSNISLISFLGIIALGGIVVNNSIVQVDRINQLRRNGMKLDDAVIEGAATRLRPILMTTLTTFFGVLPLSLADGPGARIYAPLGQAIAGGLITSTLVTLFLIPIIYRKVEDRRRNRMKRELSAA